MVKVNPSGKKATPQAESKKMTKVIVTIRRPRTNSYGFREEMVPSEKVGEYLARLAPKAS